MDKKHYEILKQGVDTWNQWRIDNPDILPDLSKAIFFRANLTGVDFTKANLFKANLTEANLYRASLYRANLFKANLFRANLAGAYLFRANLTGANFVMANLTKANLSKANLFKANFTGVDLSGAYLIDANLTGANFIGAHLIGVDFSGADLTGVNFSGADLTGANFTEMFDFTGEWKVTALRGTKLFKLFLWLIQDKKVIVGNGNRGYNKALGFWPWGAFIIRLGHTGKHIFKYTGLPIVDGIFAKDKDTVYGAYFYRKKYKGIFKMQRIIKKEDKK